MKEKEKPKEFGVCNLQSIMRITQLLDLMRVSDVRLAHNRISIQQHNPVDIKPKSTNLIEPGDGFIPIAKSEPESEKEDEAWQMLEQVANRKFVVRRGRNNRILARAIFKNVFEDNAPEEDAADKQVARSNRGQNHYLNKYEKLWSKQRDEVYQLEPARKRARKSSVFETCIEDLPQAFKDYAIQRSMLYKRGTRKVAEVPLADLVKSTAPQLAASLLSKRTGVSQSTEED